MDSQTDGPNNIEPALLRQFLASRDVPCPRCGYNLRDLAGSRCPECGDALALHVNMAEPRLAALICGLIALAVGTGLNGLLIVYAIVIVLTRRSGDSFPSFVCMCSATGIGVEGAAFFICLWNWRRIR